MKQISIVSISLLLFACSGKEEQAGLGAPAMQPSAVEVFTIQPTDVSRKIDIPGTIVASEEVQLFSEVNGRVQKIHFKEGQRVSKGALLLQVDTDILRAQKKQLQVQYELAVKDEARKKALLAAKGISFEEYEKSASAMESLEAEMALIQVQISKGEIRAPFSGRIGLRRISEGAYINPQTLITSLIQDDNVKVEFSISERYASAVNVGQQITFRVEGNTQEYTGKVFAFEPFVDAGTRMLTIRAELRNDGKLIPGSFVAIEYDLGIESGAMMVPAASIIPVLKGQKVMVVRNGIAKDLPVQVGIRTADKVQVMGDLKPGDQLLVSGLLAVRDGMPVVIKKASK